MSADDAETDEPARSVDLSRFKIPSTEEQPAHAIIARRRRQVLVHSYLYYRLGTSIIDDATFDRWAYELVELQRAYPDEAAESVFHTAFEDFDGSTGFLLPLDDPWVEGTAVWLLDILRKEGVVPPSTNQ